MSFSNIKAAPRPSSQAKGDTEEPLDSNAFANYVLLKGGTLCSKDDIPAESLQDENGELLIDAQFDSLDDVLTFIGKKTETA